MANDKTWGKKLKDFRLKAGYAFQGEFADALSKLDLGIDISSNEISRYETGKRLPKDRSRHLELIKGLVKLEGIQTVDETNEWLELGGHGYLTQQELKEVFGKDKSLALHSSVQPLVQDVRYKQPTHSRFTITRSFIQGLGGVVISCCLLMIIGIGIRGIHKDRIRHDTVEPQTYNDCLPPPPKTEPCPSLRQSRPMFVDVCQEVQQNQLMKTTAELTEIGTLKAETRLLSNDYIFGFTGRATIYFCDENNQVIDKRTNKWGVDGRFGYASSFRIENWDCPKDPLSIRGVCPDSETYPKAVIDKNVLNRVAYINVVHQHDPSNPNERIENVLGDINRFFSTLF